MSSRHTIGSKGLCTHKSNTSAASCDYTYVVLDGEEMLRFELMCGSHIGRHGGLYEIFEQYGHSVDLTVSRRIQWELCEFL